MIEYKYAITLTTRKKSIFGKIETAWEYAIQYMEYNFGERKYNWTLNIEKHPKKDLYHFHGKTTFFRWRSNNKTSDIYLHIKKITNEQSWDAYTSKTVINEFINEEGTNIDLDHY